MKKAILGKKIGMTQIFQEDGTVVPVTVVKAGPCVVVRKKTVTRDGYDAVQVGFGDIRQRLVKKPVLGQFARAGQEPKRYLREFKFEDSASYEVGQAIKADIFAEGDVVDVTATSKGHGTAGVIKRWNAQRGPKSHGASRFHRRPGSSGSSSNPSRVFKNKKNAGHYGNVRVTIQNLKVVRVDAERDLLLISGSVPGIRGALVTVREAVKA